MNLENRILKFALEEALEMIAVGYSMVKNKKNEYGYHVERRTYDAMAKRVIKLAKKDFREELREHYNKKKEE